MPALRGLSSSNFLSGSTGSFPYFVASGHSSHGTGAPRLATGMTDGVIDTCQYYGYCIDEFPRVDCFLGTCTVAFEGTNVLTMNYINDGAVRTRAGIVMADSQGGGLISSIIGLNRLGFGAVTQSAGAGNPNGGTATTAVCPTNAVLTGLTLHMRGSVSSVTGACKALTLSGSTVSMASSSTPLARIGTMMGSTNASANCPAGAVVTAFGGRSGLLVDGVQLFCSPLNANGSLGTESPVGHVGGPGGSAFSKKSCPGGMAVGLFGRAGDDLDFLALKCSILD